MSIINIFKKETQPLTSGVDTWVVEWTKRVGAYSGDAKQCFQGFTNEQDAYDFADSIKKAHKLIGNTHGTEVSVTKQKHGL